MPNPPWLHPLSLALILLSKGLCAQVQEAADLQVERGFRVERLAGGEHLAGAQDLALDRSGQPWVLVAGERLLILDRRVDGQRVFAEGLGEATSFVLEGAGVLLADRTGLQRIAEEGAQPESLFAGLVESELVIGDLAWSLDGYVYGALAGSGTWQPKRGVELRAGVFRFQSDGTKIEQVVGREQGALGVALSWSGELLFSAEGAGPAHVVLAEQALPADLDRQEVRPLGKLQAWPLDKLKAWQVLPGAKQLEATTRMLAYGGGSWPAEYEGSLLVCDPVGGQLRRLVLLPLGSSLRALAPPQGSFLRSKQPGFRPVALAGGPGGALYVLDARSTTGTLLRVQHASLGSVLPERTPGPGDDTSKLQAALLHPNLWHRLHAQRLLQQRGMSSTEAGELSSLARNSEGHLIQLHALWLGAGEADFLAWCLENYEPAVRRNALAAVQDRHASGRLRVPHGSIMALVHDADARVRLQALATWRVALGASSVTELVRIYPSLRGEYARALALAIALEHPVDVQKAVFRTRSGEPYAAWLEEVAGRVAEAGSGRDLIGMLFGLSIGNAMPALQVGIMNALHRGSRARDKPWPSPRLSSMLRRLGDSKELQVSLAAVPLAQAWGAGQISGSKVSGWTQRATDTLEQGTGSPELRAAAARALLAVPGSREAGLRFAGLLLEPELSDAQQLLLVDELCATPDQTAGAVLLRALPKLKPRALELARVRVLAEESWASALVEALESGALEPELMDAGWRRGLSAHPDEQVAARAKAFFARQER